MRTRFLTTICMILLGINSSYAQLFENSFDNNDFSANWVETLVSGNSDWTEVTTGSAPTCMPFDGAVMLKFNSFSSGTGSQSRVRTNALNFSGTSYLLSFYMYHDPSWASSNDRIDIQISTNGTDWTSISTITRYSATTGWLNHIIDLSAYDNQTSVYVGFLGTSGYGYNMFIDKVQICNNCPTSLNEIKNSVKATLYPVPAIDLLKVSLEQALDEDYTVEIKNMEGKTMFTTRNEKSITDFELPVSALSAGNYLVFIYNSFEKGTLQFIKK